MRLSPILFSILLLLVSSCDDFRDREEGEKPTAVLSGNDAAEEGDESEDGPWVHNIPSEDGASDDAAGSSTSSRSSALPGGIEIFFSDAYANDPSIGKNDPGNIDRHLAGFIASAKKRLDCAFFELESERVAGAIIAAKRRGVKVRVVGDSDYRENPEMVKLIDAGIPVVFDERSALMHNKFVVVDGARVWTGSFNATDNCAFRNNNNGMRIESKELAENYTTEFEEMFRSRSFGPRSPSATPNSLVKVAGVDIYNYFSPEDEIPPKIVRFLRAARRDIRFMAFSFTDGTVGDALLDMKKKGIDIEGVVERRGSDGRGAQMSRLVAGGIPVHRDGNSYAMHHKVFIIDNLWTITGSYNFTASGARSNDENIIIIKSEAIARKFRQEYERVKQMGRNDK